MQKSQDFHIQQRDSRRG